MRVTSPDAMEALGRRLGAVAQPGTVIALSGDLGAGKSVLARGIARGLGITGRIPSPTFILVAEYTQGRIPLHHGDLYRLTGPDDVMSVGLDEFLGGEGIVVLEWADRFPEILPADHLAIRIEIGPTDDEREVSLCAGGPISRSLEATLG